MRVERDREAHTHNADLPHPRLWPSSLTLSPCPLSAPPPPLVSFNVVRTYCGHGIGDLFHCAPNIPHYAGNKAVGAMKAGQVFTIEPMVNAGSWRDTTWPDGWTAVTTDGARSAQFEHTLVVTEDGCEVLTARLPTSPPLCF